MPEKPTLWDEVRARFRAKYDEDFYKKFEGIRNMAPEQQQFEIDRYNQNARTTGEGGLVTADDHLKSEQGKTIAKHPQLPALSTIPTVDLPVAGQVSFPSAGYMGPPSEVTVVQRPGTAENVAAHEAMHVDELMREPGSRAEYAKKLYPHEQLLFRAYRANEHHANPHARTDAYGIDVPEAGTEHHRQDLQSKVVTNHATLAEIDRRLAGLPEDSPARKQLQQNREAVLTVLETQQGALTELERKKAAGKLDK